MCVHVVTIDSAHLEQECRIYRCKGPSCPYELIEIEVSVELKTFLSLPIHLSLMFGLKKRIIVKYPKTSSVAMGTQEGRYCRNDIKWE